MEITKEYLTQENTVFHCETEEEANRLLKIADGFGLNWINRGSYLNKNEWKAFKEETCYDFNDGSFGDSGWFKSEGLDIINSRNVLSKEIFLISFKDGEDMIFNSDSFDLNEFVQSVNSNLEYSFLYIHDHDMLINMKEVNYIRKR